MSDELKLEHEVGHYERLLHQDAYTAQEAAEVLNVSERWILKAAFGGRPQGGDRFRRCD